jgi:hypothetical protein
LDDSAKTHRQNEQRGKFFRCSQLRMLPISRLVAAQRTIRIPLMIS